MFILKATGFTVFFAIRAAWWQAPGAGRDENRWKQHAGNKPQIHILQSGRNCVFDVLHLRFFFKVLDEFKKRIIPQGFSFESPICLILPSFI